MRRIAGALLLAALAACGPGTNTGPDGGALVRCPDRPLTFTGTQGLPVSAELISNVFTIPATVGATATRLLVDTGSPITLFDPTVLKTETLPKGQGPLGKLQVGALNFQNATVVGAAIGVTLPDGPLAGIFGGDLVCHFPTSFNYREVTVTLGEGAAPANLQPAVTGTIEIEGGGTGAIPLGGSFTTVELPPTRIAVTATLEGVERHFIIDSGASYTVVSTTVFDSLVIDGRKLIDMIPAATVMGAVGTRITRAKSLVLAGAEVKGSLVSSLDGTALLAQLGLEVNHPVDGLLGGTFLREFYVTADYRTGALKLARYTTRDHIADEFTRVGIAISEIPNHAAGTPRYTISRVFAGSDAAAKGIASMGKLVKIDGVDLETVAPLEAERALLGAAGTTKVLQTDTATATVAVEDLIPLQ